MTQKPFQRLVIYLRSGQTIGVDFNIHEQNKLNPQVELFVKALGQPSEQDKIVVFEGQKLVGVRIAEVAAYEVLSLILTPQTEPEKNGKESATD